MEEGQEEGKRKLMPREILKPTRGWRMVFLANSDDNCFSSLMRFSHFVTLTSESPLELDEDTTNGCGLAVHVPGLFREGVDVLMSSTLISLSPKQASVWP